MAISYFLGQRHYPIPYEWKKCIVYIAVAYILYLIHQALRNTNQTLFIVHGTGILLLTAFILYVVKKEKNELTKIPLLKNLFPNG